MPNEYEFYEKKIINDPNIKGAIIRTFLDFLYESQFKPRESLLQISKDIFLMIPSVIYTVKNFYLLNALNDQIERIKSAGLMGYWCDQFIDRKLLNLNSPRYPEALTLRHFKGSFFILGFGFLLSFVAFKVELILLAFRKKIPKV